MLAPDRARGLVRAAGQIGLAGLVVSDGACLVLFASRLRGLWQENDFRLYLAGARVALAHGWSHLYDVPLHQAEVAQLHPAGHWWALLTPPPIAWMMVPFTWLPYPLAYALWMVLVAALVVLAFALARPAAGPYRAAYLPWALALYPAWFTVYLGQASAIAAVAVVGCWWLLERRRDRLAGLALAPILLKPHLALLVPVLLLGLGRWRAAATWAAATAVLAALSVATLGLEASRGYVALLLAPQPWGDVLATPAAQLGRPVAVAIGALALALAVAVGRRTPGRDLRTPFALAILASFAVATYWHPQDYLVFGVAAALQAGGPRRLHLAAGLAFAGVAILSSPFNPELTIWARVPHSSWWWFVLAAGWLVLAGVSAFRAPAPPRSAPAPASGS